MHITSATFDRSAPNLGFCPDETLPEFALIGRSNVGKSTLLNTLTGKEGLAKVSPTPGFTKTINFFTINRTWRLVDLPGYGFAHVAKEQRSRFNDAVNDYLVNRPNLVCVFVLIDSNHPPQEIDLEFVDWLASEGVPFVLVFTKTDRLEREEVEKNMALFKEQIAEMFENIPEIYTTSSITRHGVPDLLKTINDALEPFKK